MDRVSEALKPHEGAIAAKGRRAKVHDIDETTWYQHGVLAWLWVMVTTTVSGQLRFAGEGCNMEGL